MPEITTRGIIGLKWLPSQFDGGSPLIDYEIIYDQSNGTFVTLKQNVLGTLFTVKDLTPGLVYAFKIRSRNS